MSTSFYTMATSLNIDQSNNNEDENDDEQAPLDNNSQPLDEHILSIIRKTKKDEQDGHRTIRPALLASELGLSVEDATRELCGLLSAVGGGINGASFVFEKVDMPGQVDGISNKATTMVFTFPHDFESRAKKYRRQSDMKQRLQVFTTGLIKFIKVFTAFGLIISLAVLIIAGICLLVAAVIALARGGHNGGGHRNHPLMHRLRYLFFQLRQILWLYAICGSAVDGNQDPFMRECAGDLAFILSMFCGNPMHPFFWFRVGGMRRRWARVRRTRGWGDSNGAVDAFWTRGDGNGQSIMRRGTWGDDNEEDDRMMNQSSSGDQQRGLLSIAVEFLFGHDGNTSDDNLYSSKERQRWKFLASVIISLSTTSEGNGVSLRELLQFVDNPPASADHPSAIRETLRLVTYFNGQPVSGIDSESSSGIDARFCFPELVSEMDYSKLLTIGSSEFAPPSQHSIDNRANISSILYKEDREFDFGSSDASNGTPEYLYEQPLMLTQLSRTQFGQCVLLGILNFVGIIWVQNALSPGGIFALPISAKSVSGGRSLIALASILLLKLLNILRFYSKLFLLLPFSRMIIVVIRNLFVDKRNKRRKGFIRVEL